jgi:catechol 2,3-dioxygenase-like lactoylglutathione lyase family enzyme
VLDHVTIRVSGFEASKRFYDRVLAPLGVGEAYVDDGFAEWGDFSIAAGAPVTRDLHVAFAASSREQVDEFHAAAMAAGCLDNGAPGERPQYHAGYYGAYVLDPEELSSRAVRTHRLHPPVLVVDEAEEGGSASAAVLRRRTERLPGTTAIARPVQVDSHSRAAVGRHPTVPPIRKRNVVDRINSIGPQHRRGHVAPTAILIEEQPDRRLDGLARFDRPVCDRVAEPGRHEPRRPDGHPDHGPAVSRGQRRPRHRADNAHNNRD